jgi:hypothetical protein
MRRRYITHPRFQFWFVFAYIRGALISIGGGAAVLFAALYFLAQDPSLRPEQSLRVTEFMSTLAWVFGAIAAGTLLLFVFIGVYLSYKMAGPIRRIEDWLVRKNTEDNVPPLTLRPGDEWIPVIAKLNQLSDKQP